MLGLLPFVLLYLFNVTIGAVFYLSVVRRGRSLWWLLAFKLCSVPVGIAYVITGWKGKGVSTAKWGP